MPQSENGLDKKNEYKKAAKRHLDTCRYMLDHLEKIKLADNYDKNNILMDIYYLSGYIIECAGNFGMLYLYPNKELSKIHNFQHNLIPSLDSGRLKLDLGQLVDNSGVKDLYKEWKTEVRYKEKILNEAEVKKFVTLSEGIYNSITQHIPGK